MRAQIVCELATAHGGNVALAADMIRAAADAGADMVKLQSYDLTKLNPLDPQAAWLRQAHLDKAAHEHLLKVGADCGVPVFSTPFDADSLQMLRDLGLRTFKIASSEADSRWWRDAGGIDLATERAIVSWPWGVRKDGYWALQTHLTAIPLYPTPLECMSRITLLDGLSDHTEGIAACQWAIARGAKMVEVHFKTEASRQKPWDKSAEQVRALRKFAEDCATMQTGVSETYRTRWSA